MAATASCLKAMARIAQSRPGCARVRRAGVSSLSTSNSVGSRLRRTSRSATARSAFWKAIEEVFQGTRHQRCWVHKTANVLNKVALSVQINMKADLREIYGAPTRAAEAAIDVFADKYGAKYDRAVACLTKDREALLAFFDF
jgi:transposase-like protein